MTANERSEDDHPVRRSLARAVVSMSSVTFASVLLALITAPVQARALGPTGRGDLAAIAVVLGLAPTLLDFGLSAFVGRELARGTSSGELYGTMLVPALAFSLLGDALALPVAHLVGHGRPEVTRFIELGLWLSPLTVGLQTLSIAAWAERRWGLINRLRLTPPVTTAIAYVTLYALHHLTVETAAIVTIGSSLLSSVQVLPLLWSARGWAMSRGLATAGLRFGARSWLNTILAQGNGYIDQLLMTTLTSARQLGLYAVATTVASVSTSVIVAPFTIARYRDVAMGDYQSVPRLCRTMLVAVSAFAVVLGAAGSVALYILFGSGFDDAVPMVLILLVSSVPGSLATMVSGLLGAAGRPGESLRAQAAGLACSVPLLAAVLPLLGGLGACGVDIVTNLTVAAVALRYGVAAFGGRIADYCRPTRREVEELRTRAQQWLRTARRPAPDTKGR